MTVYTVSSNDSVPKFDTNFSIVGSYTTRGRALDECVQYILDRLRTRDDLAYCMAHDENHPEAEEFFGKRKTKDDWGFAVKRGRREALREHLRDELAGQGCYYAYCQYGGDDYSFHFDVDENDVEGELWHTVTWGDSDCEDPEFTTPWPEAFASEEKAIESFYRYALDLKRDREMPVSEGFRSFVYESLRKDGKCQVDLADGCCVSCVLYHDDAKNIKE